MSDLADTRRDAPEGPDAPEKGADRVASRLRAEPVDAAALARAEMRFVEAVGRRSTPKSAHAAWWGFGLAAVVGAGLVIVSGLGAGVWPGDEERGVQVAQGVTPLRAGMALGGARAMRGVLGHATLEAVAGTRARVLTDDVRDASVRLDLGELRVVFDPLRRGEEHLAIDTPSARVEVVGTAFFVRVTADGATRVEVTHGIVEVLARATGVRRRLAAGASLDVGARVVAAPRASNAVAARADSPAHEAETRVDSAANPANPEPRIPTDTDDRIATSREARPSPDARPSLAAALVALEAGDTAPCEQLAASGPRALRLDALEALADRHEQRGSVAPAEAAYAKILALDPRGARGATALFARASLRERTGTSGAADDFARYLTEHPRGALAAQARAHLCALEPARCPSP
jgi:hypothetical protein